MRPKINQVAGVSLFFIALAFLPVIVQYPMAQFGLNIPLLTGGFLRSVMAILVLAAVWTYRYGIRQMFLLGVMLVGVLGLVGDTMMAAAQGGNFFANFYRLLADPSSTVLAARVTMGVAGVVLLLRFHLYRLNKVSLAMFAVYAATTAAFVVFSPPLAPVAELNVPRTFFGQALEFAPVIASLAFAYSFFRPYNRGGRA